MQKCLFDSDEKRHHKTEFQMKVRDSDWTLESVDG